MRSYIVPAYAYVKHDDTTYIHGKINIAAAANSQQACTAAQQHSSTDSSTAAEYTAVYTYCHAT